MKRTVLILSLVAPVVLFVAGGFFFAASGFGFDVGRPYNDPYVVGATLVGFTPGLALAVVALGMRLYATARDRQVGWFIGLLVWPVVPIVAGVLMLDGAVGYSGSWWLAGVFVPLATLIYGAIGPVPPQATRLSGAQGPAVHPPDPVRQSKAVSGLLSWSAYSRS
jgi:hypothetical protein